MWPLVALIAAGLGAGVWWTARDPGQGAAGQDEPGKAPPDDGGRYYLQEPGGNPPRGIRNANPGNIRRTGTDWQGMAEDQNDPAFIEFQNPIWGIRALARTLETYQSKHGLKSVEGIIGRWAPPEENDTRAYIRAVADRLGVAPGEPQPWTPSQTRELIAAIIHHENGIQPYRDSAIEKGMQRA